MSNQFRHFIEGLTSNKIKGVVIMKRKISGYFMFDLYELKDEGFSGNMKAYRQVKVKEYGKVRKYIAKVVL